MARYKSLQDFSLEIAESYKPDTVDDTRWHTSGLIDFHAPFNRFVLDKALPLITEGADQQVGRRRSQHIDRSTAAILLDWNLRRLAQGKAVIDLRLGEFLIDFRKRHPEKLGYVRLPDYTLEELGIPWRSASLLVGNWTALSGLPCLLQAHREGKISKSKLRWLLRVVTPQNEEAWIEKASRLSVRALEEEVRAEEAKKSGEGESGNESSSPGESEGKCLPVVGGSGSSVEEERSGYLMSLETTPERAAAWDFVLEHFRGHEGGNFSTTFFIEALLAEFCSAVPLPGEGVLPGNGSLPGNGALSGNGALPDNGVFPDTGSIRASSTAAGNIINAASQVSSFSQASQANPGRDAAQANPHNSACPTSITPPLPGGAHCRRITGSEDDDFLFSGVNGKELDEERKYWRALRRDLEDVTKMWEFLSWTPVTVETPAEWDDLSEDARAVDRILKKLVAMRQSVAFYMGRLLRTVENLHLYADMHFASFNHYVVERLGISMRTARNLIKLVRGFFFLPLVEKAFRDGVLTQERALLVLKVVTEKTEREWLKYGVEVPVLNLEREVRRLSRLIEGDRNLLERYRVIPGFEPQEEAKNPADSSCESDSQGSQALDVPSDGFRKSSCTSKKMCAAEMLPDASDPETADSSRKMCATEMLQDAGCSEDDDSPWEVRLNNDITDINDPSELDSWKMVISGTLPDAGALEASGPSRKMCATEMLPDASDPETAGLSRKMSATEHAGHPLEEIITEEELPMSPGPGNAGGSSSSLSSGNASSPDSCGHSYPCSAPNPVSAANPFSAADPRNGRDTAAICFFVPDDLIPLWNYAFMRYLELVTGTGIAEEAASSITQEHESTSGKVNADVSTITSSYTENGSLTLEGFLFSLIYHYLENERIYQRKKRRLYRHKVIERDGFKCIIPGCSSRLVLTDHHIKYRSRGGGDELSNNTGACRQHHQHCIHDNHYITVTGTAPDNLTIAMGVEGGRSPFALFINGRRKAGESP
ncbi:MAG: HNH endonuclease [Vulcanimicrobiota bacterium]